MARLVVEQWAPEYGAPIDPDEALAPSEGDIDVGVEVAGDWSPISGLDDGFPVVAFVDGVRRIDARLTLDDPDAGPVAGICGSYAVGAVLWRRGEERAQFHDVRVERLAILGSGEAAELPPLDMGLSYRTESAPGGDNADLIARFHTAMRRSETELALELAEAGYFVVADGPISGLSPEPLVGYIKAHRVSYLGAPQSAVIGRLAPGERTPLFLLPSYSRYSWYLRLADVAGGHSWSGIARLEATAALPLAEVRQLADRTAAVLPFTSSLPHHDPRAPQNLVPIGALEREMRRHLGDAALVYRALRAATMRSEVPV